MAFTTDARLVNTTGYPGTIKSTPLSTVLNTIFNQKIEKINNISTNVSGVVTLNLYDIADVNPTVSGVSDGQLLSFNGTSGKWEASTLIIPQTISITSGTLATRPLTPTVTSVYIVEGDLINDGRTFIYNILSGTPSWIEVLPKYTFDDLTNVNVSSAVSGDTIVFDGSEWVPQASGLNTLDGLNDVSTSGAVIGNTIMFDGTSWIASGTVPSLATLSDTSGVNSAVYGDILSFDGTSWIPTSSDLNQTLDELHDVVVSGAVVDDFLKFDGTNWVSSTVTPPSLASLTDVNVSGVIAGDNIVFDGTAWVPSASGVHVLKTGDTMTGSLVVDSSSIDLKNANPFVSGTINSSSIELINNTDFTFHYKKTSTSEEILLDKNDFGVATHDTLSLKPTGIVLDENISGISHIDIGETTKGMISLTTGGVPSVPVLDEHVSTKKYVDDLLANQTLSSHIDVSSGIVAGDTLVFDGSLWMPVPSGTLDTSKYTGEPTGFPMDSTGAIDRSSSSISFDNASRTFTIAPTSTSFEVIIKGKKLTKTSESITIPNSTGNYYIYFDESGVIQYTPVFSLEIIYKYVYLANVYWNATQSKAIVFGDERHGVTMDSHTHAHLHTSMGAVYIGGCGLETFVIDGDGSLDSQSQFGVELGLIRDEDILHSLPAISSTTPLPVLYRLGGEWNSDLGSFNFKTGINGRAQYNSGGAGSYALSEAASGSLVLIHVVATNDPLQPFISLMGLNEYSNKTQAREGAMSEIGQYTDLPFMEFVFIGTVILQTKDSFANSGKTITVSTDLGGNYVDWRFTESINPVAALQEAASRVYVDSKFAGDTSGGAVDYFKAPQLNISGTLDTSFINLKLDELSDVSPGAFSGDTIVFDGLNWIPQASGTSLSNLLDVNLSSPIMGNLLQYNGMQWENVPEYLGYKSKIFKYALGNPEFPVGITYDGVNRNVSTEAELVTAITNSVAGDTISLTSDITITSTITINKSIKIIGAGFVIQTAGAGSDPVTMISVTASNVFIDNGLTLRHMKTTNTSVECVLNLNATGFVSNANVEFVEFGYILRGSFSIGGTTTYRGALGNNHRHFGIYKVLFPSQINGVVYDFPSEATTRSSFVYLSSSSATDTFDDILYIANTRQLNPSRLQRQFYLQDAFVKTVGKKHKLWIEGNTWDDVNGGVGLLGAAGAQVLDNFEYIALYNNTQGNGGIASYKGLLYIDGSGALHSIGATNWYYSNNVHPVSLRSDYSSAFDLGGVAYRNTVYNLYSVTLVDEAQLYDNALKFLSEKGVSTFAALTDVDVINTPPSNGDFISWDSANSQWIPVPPTTVTPEVLYGTLASRPASPTTDTIYIVDGDATTTENQKFYYYKVSNSTWVEIGYVKKEGDIMTGTLILEPNIGAGVQVRDFATGEVTFEVDPNLASSIFYSFGGYTDPTVGDLTEINGGNVNITSGSANPTNPNHITTITPGFITVNDGTSNPPLVTDPKHLTPKGYVDTNLGGHPLDNTLPSDGQVLSWNVSGWVPTVPSIDFLSDVDTTSTGPTVGQSLLYDGTNWVPGDVSFISSLAGLSDVNISGVEKDDVLQYDGTNWIKKTDYSPYRSTQALYNFTDATFPKSGVYLGTNRNVATQAELTTAITNSVTGDTITLAADINLTALITFNKSIKVIGNGFKLFTLGSQSSPPILISVTANNVTFDSSLTIEHAATGFTSAVFTDCLNFVSNANVSFKVFGYVLRGSFSIGGTTTNINTDNSLNTHVSISRLTAPSQINGVTYNSTFTSSTGSTFSRVNSSLSTPSDFWSSLLYIANNRPANSTIACISFFNHIINNSSDTMNSNKVLVVDNNVFKTITNNIRFEAPTNYQVLNGFRGIAVTNNIATTTSTTNYRGFINIDALGSAAAINPGTTDFIYFNNTHPSTNTLDANYASAYDNGSLTYRIARFTAPSITPLTDKQIFENALKYAPSVSIDNLSDVDTATAAPVTGQVLGWNGTNWVPATHPIITTGLLSARPTTGLINGQIYTVSGETVTTNRHLNGRSYTYSLASTSWLELAPNHRETPAPVRYVSPWGHDTNNTGSATSPYLTIAKAISDLTTNGGTVYLYPGNYGGNVTLTNSLISIIGMTSGNTTNAMQVNIDGVLRISGSSFRNRFENLSITATSSTDRVPLIISSSTAQHEFKNIRFSPFNSSSNAVLVSSSASDYIRFIDCEFISSGTVELNAGASVTNGPVSFERAKNLVNLYVRSAFTSVTVKDTINLGITHEAGKIGLFNCQNVNPLVSTATSSANNGLYIENSSTYNSTTNTYGVVNKSGTAVYTFKNFDIPRSGNTVSGTETVSPNSNRFIRFNEIRDVDLITTSPVNGNYLRFDGTNWIPANIASSLSGLSDVNVTGVVANNMLIFDGNKWVPQTASIDFLTDVDTTATGPSLNNVLTWNGTNWVPKASNFNQASIGYTSATPPSFTGILPGTIWIEDSTLNQYIYIKDANGNNVWVSLGSNSNSIFLRKDIDDTFSGNLTSSSGKFVKFSHASQSTADDGKIGSGLLGSGLNIIGAQTSAGLGRQIRIWGSVITDTGDKYWNAGNDGSGSGLDADTLDGKQASEFTSIVRSATPPSSPQWGDMWVDTTTGVISMYRKIGSVSDWVEI